MTGRFEHVDERTGGSWRLVLAHADASAAREVRRRLRRGRRHGRSPRRRPLGPRPLWGRYQGARNGVEERRVGDEERPRTARYERRTAADGGFEASKDRPQRVRM